MKVIYRVSPFSQDNASPIYPLDKDKLVKLSYDSFKTAGKYDTIFLLDRCSYDFFDGNVIHFVGTNKQTSLIKAYEIAYDINDDILFVEDDYLWLPDTLEKIEQALQEFKLVSPYDHPDHYVHPEFAPKHELRLYNGQVWRSGVSNTHTFAVNKDYFMEHFNTFMRYGVNDHAMFKTLPDNIWQPVPSFATHLVSQYMAPNIDWKSVWTNFL